MPTLHFIAVGGTGHKVLQSLIHITACGAFKGNAIDELHVLTIDADISNGNLTRTRETLAEYQKFYRALEGCRGKRHCSTQAELLKDLRRKKSFNVQSNISLDFE